MIIGKEYITDFGKKILVDSVRHDDKTFVITGKYCRVIKLRDEWYDDVEEPETIIELFKQHKVKADILDFFQRLPEIEPKYGYYKEWESVAAIPIKSFDDWWLKQINDKTRNMARKAEKKGVEIKFVDFDDNFVQGVINIFNESPVKRGKPFRHYGKDFDTVKKEMSDRLDKSQFIGAYYNEQLIGFIKVNFTDRYAMITVILSLQEHRDKSPINALLMKAVKLCAEKKIPYLTYFAWRRGSHGDFQKHNGFVKILLPRFYVPLTLRGKVLLKLNLHNGIKGILPEKTLVRLLEWRKRFYELKYQKLTKA